MTPAIVLDLGRYADAPPPGTVPRMPPAFRRVSLPLSLEKTDALEERIQNRFHFDDLEHEVQSKVEQDPSVELDDVLEALMHHRWVDIPKVEGHLKGPTVEDNGENAIRVEYRVRVDGDVSLMLYRPVHWGADDVVYVDPSGETRIVFECDVLSGVFPRRKSLDDVKDDISADAERTHQLLVDLAKNAREVIERHRRNARREITRLFRDLRD